VPVPNKSVKPIDDWYDCLLSGNPPRVAQEERQCDAQLAVEGDHYHTVTNPM
jgi:hypothetical protein